MWVINSAETFNDFVSYLSGKVDTTIYLQEVSEQKYKTYAQNNTFHKLIEMWVNSGDCSYSFEGAKYLYKIKAGIISHWSYVYNGAINRTKEFEDIPVQCVETAKAEPKSWSDATKKEAIKAIDLLIADMLKSGFSSKKFDKMITEFKERRW